MRGLGSQSSASFVIRVPGRPVLLAAPPKRAPPEVGDMVAEGRERATVGRHGVVVEEAAARPAPASCPARGSAGACAVAAPP